METRNDLGDSRFHPRSLNNNHTANWHLTGITTSVKYDPASVEAKQSYFRLRIARTTHYTGLGNTGSTRLKTGPYVSRYRDIAANVADFLPPAVAVTRSVESKMLVAVTSHLPEGRAFSVNLRMPEWRVCVNLRKPARSMLRESR